MKLSEKQILDHSHIPTGQIQRDIDDTQKEIDDFEGHLKIWHENPAANKLEIYMAEGKVSQRESFIEKLQSIVDYREASLTPN